LVLTLAISVHADLENRCDQGPDVGHSCGGLGTERSTLRKLAVERKESI
jgi:hypothetical protein